MLMLTKSRPAPPPPSLWILCSCNLKKHSAKKKTWSCLLWLGSDEQTLPHHTSVKCKSSPLGYCCPFIWPVTESLSHQYERGRNTQIIWCIFVKTHADEGSMNMSRHYTLTCRCSPNPAAALLFGSIAIKRNAEWTIHKLRVRLYVQIINLKINQLKLQ